MQLKRTNAMKIPLVLVRVAHKIALVTLISGDGFNCEGASNIRPWLSLCQTGLGLTRSK